MQGCWTGLRHWLRPEKEETTLVEALVRHSNRIRIWRSSCPQCLDTGEIEDIGRTGKWPCPWCRPVLVGAAAADPDEGWKCDCALAGKCTCRVPRALLFAWKSLVLGLLATRPRAGQRLQEWYRQTQWVLQLLRRGRRVRRDLLVGLGQLEGIETLEILEEEEHEGE